jgi:hypothetical protein
MSGTNVNLTKEEELQLLRTILSVIDELFPEERFMVKTVMMTTAEVKAVLQKQVTTIETTKSLNDQWHTSAAAQKDGRPMSRAATDSIRSLAKSRFGNTSDNYKKLGFKPPKPRKTSVKAKAAGVDKSLATREARHTLGSQQKKAIHGDAPAAAPATPPTTTAPSTKPGGGSGS